MKTIWDVVDEAKRDANRVRTESIALLGSGKIQPHRERLILRIAAEADSLATALGAYITEAPSDELNKKARKGGS